MGIQDFLLQLSLERKGLRQLIKIALRVGFVQRVKQELQLSLERKGLRQRRCLPPSTIYYRCSYPWKERDCDSITGEYIKPYLNTKNVAVIPGKKGIATTASSNETHFSIGGCSYPWKERDCDCIFHVLRFGFACQVAVIPGKKGIATKPRIGPGNIDSHLVAVIPAKKGIATVGKVILRRIPGEC